MKIKRRYLALLIMLIFIVALSQQVFAATNGTVQINAAGNYLVKDGGTTIVPDANPPALPNNFLFFEGSVDPSATSNGFQPSAASKPDASTYKYDFVGAGKTVAVMATNGNKYGMTSSGYVFSGGAYSSQSIVLSGTDPKTFELNFMLDHEKKTPYAPSSIGVVEAQTRINDAQGEGTSNVEMTLATNIAPNIGNSPNIRDIYNYNGKGSYCLLVYRAGDAAAPIEATSGDNITAPTLIRTTSSSIVLKGAYFEPNKKYLLVAWNRNWWTTPNDAPTSFNKGAFGSDATANYFGKEWTPLGGGAGGGPSNQTFELNKTTTGVNTLSVPFTATDTTTKPIVQAGNTLTNSLDTNTDGKVTVQELIQAINAQSKAAGLQATNVSVFGWYDSATQKHKGLTSIPTNAYDAAGKITTPANITATQGDDVNALLSTVIDATPYQVSVREAMTGAKAFVLNGYRQ